MTSTSVMRGTRCSTTSLSHRIAAAMMGRAAFFAPGGASDPSRRRPPSTISLVRRPSSESITTFYDRSSRLAAGGRKLYDGTRADLKAGMRPSDRAALLCVVTPTFLRQRIFGPPEVGSCRLDVDLIPRER